MLKAILIDDESNNLDTLRKDIEAYCPQVIIVACCNSGKEGLMKIHEYKPDLIFLDIDMPVMTGFEMLQCIDRIYFDVIFTTAHQQYAIDAFRISAVVDYLLKPVQQEQLIEAVQRVEQRTNRGIPIQQFEALVENLTSDTKRIVLRASSGLDFIPTDKIIYAQSEGNYITLTKIGEKKKKPPYTTFTLGYLEKSLPESDFCRIHQSYLININHTLNYNRNEKFVEMINGNKLPVSTGGRGKLLSKLNLK